MLTKQLQVLIDVSLSSGRSFDDIRAILKIQGFGDEKIDGVFADYRAKGQAAGGKEQIVATYSAPPVPTAPELAVPIAPAAPEPSMSEAVTVEVSADFLPDSAMQAPQAPTSFETPVGLYTPKSNVAATSEANDVELVDVDDAFGTPSAPPQQFEAPVITPNHTSTAPVMPAFMAGQHTAVPVPPVPASGQTPAQPQPVMPSAPIAPASTPPVPDFSERGVDVQDDGIPEAAASLPTFTSMPKAGGINVGLGGIPELENAALEDYKRKQASSPVPLIITLIVVVALIGASAYWFFVLGPGKPQTSSFDEFLSQRATSTAPEPFKVPLSDEDASIRAGFPSVEAPTTRIQSQTPAGSRLPVAPATTAAAGVDPFTGQAFPTE